MEPYMIAIFEILFSRDSSRNHYHVTRGRFSRLQSYMVPFLQIIAIICGSPLSLKVGRGQGKSALKNTDEKQVKLHSSQLKGTG